MTQISPQTGPRWQIAPGGNGAWGVGWTVLLILLLSCHAEIAPDSKSSVFGVQLHTHGSLSEGPASMAAHDHAARGLGGAVDVIWWTDHDWRIDAHTYVDGFDFEKGWVESRLAPVPLRQSQLDGRVPIPAWGLDTPWSPDGPAERSESFETRFALRQPPRRPERWQMEFTEIEARSGDQSLHLVAEGAPKGGDRIVLGLQSARRRHIASLASGVELGLSVLPAELQGEVRFALAIGLSQREPGLRSRIEYVLKPASAAGPPGEARIDSKTSVQTGDRVDLATIPIPTELGFWNDWAIDLTQDADRLGLGGRDNALFDLSLMIELGPKARLDIFIDQLSIERGEVGPALFAHERDMAEALSDTSLRHHVGQEISYGAHLNAYGSEIPLVDSARHPHGLSPSAAVAWAHDHGGLVSLAHFFGTDFSGLSHEFPSSREVFDASRDRLIANQAYGVDLLEVGYRSRGHLLDAFLELWDALSGAGIVITGVGVSDSHDAEVGWSEGPNNFITWIHADSMDEEDLLEGLLRGRAFFGDPTRFDGRMDIETAAGGRMGEVLSVTPGPQRLTLRAEGLREGQWVRVIVDGQPMRAWEPEGPIFQGVYEIDVAAPSFVRFEILEGDEPIALSNPIHFRLDERS